MSDISRSKDLRARSPKKKTVVPEEQSEATHHAEKSNGRPSMGSQENVEFDRPPVVVNPQVDVVWLVLMGVAAGTRLFNLAKPGYVVFDEVHFGKFTNYFLHGKFFFDVHPPLSKLIFALAAYLSGYDGKMVFNDIGQDLGEHAEAIWYLRLVPAVFGFLIVPITYEILLELQCSYWVAVFGAFLVTFDNMLVVQSRFILVDAPMLFFIAASICFYLKFRKHSRRPFSVMWWLHLSCLGVCLTGAASSKYSGLLTVLLIGCLIAYDFWKEVDDLRTPGRQLVHQFVARATALIVMPCLLYLLQFYILLSILYKSGPNDDMMSSAFQNTLVGGLSTITRHQAKEVAYGSQITLRSDKVGQQCWLHSHDHLYPVKYPDGRGSSAQQQVTCYAFKDVNNWWIVKRPDSEELVVNYPPKPVRNGDIIHLVHGTTGRGLNSHDVAAPLNPQFMEVAGYINHNVSMDPQLGWRLEIIDEQPGAVWRAIDSRVRFVHVNTSASMKVTGGTLPDWGFQQFEVADDRTISTQESIWNVEEHNQNISYPEGVDPKKIQEELKTTKEDAAILQMPFLSKFWELQIRMLKANTDLQKEHAFATRPSAWPFMRGGVAYWIHKQENRQIFCIGNPFVWWIGVLGILAYLALLGGYLLRRRRAVYDLSCGQWDMFVLIGNLLVGGYFLNLLPYFPMERTLFIHHYLPSLVFKILLVPIVVEHLYMYMKWYFPQLRHFYVASVVAYCVLVLVTFHFFSPFTYGTHLPTSKEINSRKWLSTWKFLIHPNT